MTLWSDDTTKGRVRRTPSDRESAKSTTTRGHCYPVPGFVIHRTSGCVQRPTRVHGHHAKGTEHHHPEKGRRALTGTHQGEFKGVASTGKRIKVHRLQIGRFDNGQIVERWGSTDELGIMTQLGAAPDASGKPGLVDKVKDVFTS